MRNTLCACFAFSSSEPPPRPPVISLDGRQLSGDIDNNNVTVTEGHAYDMSCHVFGGFPEVENLTLQCAGIPVTEGYFTFSLDMNLSNCSCVADHISGCYHLTTELRLLVVGKS